MYLIAITAHKALPIILFWD